MEFRVRHLVGNFFEGVDGNVNTLMPLESAGEDDDLPAVFSRAGAILENVGVHVVDEDGAFARRGRTRGVFFQPQMIREDDVVGEPGGEPLHGLERAHGEGAVGDAELAPVKFRHDVVDVQEHLRALEFGVPGGEHHEVGDVVDVDQVIGFLAVTFPQPQRRGGQEAQQGPEKIQLGLFIFSGAGLQPVDLDAGHEFLFREFRAAAEGHDVHLVAALGQGFGIAGHAVVVLVKRMRDHADPAGLAVAEQGFHGGDVPGHVAGQGMPEGFGMMCPDMLQEIDVMLDRKGARGGTIARKVNVVRMNIQQRHAAVPGDPVQLLDPDFGIGFLEQQEQRGVLREGVGEFGVAVVAVGNPEGENGVAAVRLRLKRIGVKRGGVVLDLQVMQPAQVVEHEAGAETGRIPVLEVTIDVFGVLPELFPVPVEAAVMLEVMHAHLEAFGGQFRAQSGSDPVAALGDEVEGGTEAEGFFNRHQLAAFAETGLAFHVMRQHQREFFFLRPAAPVFGRAFRTRRDGPDVLNQR